MRLSYAAGILVVFSMSALAQRRAFSPAMHPPQAAPPPMVVPSVGALGGSYASVGRSRPLGGIAPPTFPAGVRNIHRPPYSDARYRYVGPVYYVPSASDYGYESSFGPPYSSFAPGYSSFNNPAYTAPNYDQGPAPQPPVIINNYYGVRGPGNQPEESTSSERTVNPGDPLDESAKYYLIAYKDRSVYTALAYWLEGDILHYVTTQNTHNQASLSLIDLDQTTKLNAGNSVPFSLAGKQP